MSTNDFEKKLTNLQQQITILETKTQSLDTKLIQDQINSLRINYLNLIDKQQKDNIRYEQLVQELNTLYELIENSNNRINTICQTPVSNNKIFTCSSKKHMFTIDFSVNFVFITMVAGGGAGGIGFIRNMYYYSGGGGGAGACFIKKPVRVEKNYTLLIKVGKGGDINGSHGQDTCVKIVDQCGKCQEKIVVCGGKNGYPNYNMLNQSNEHISVCGGFGGENCVNCFSGSSGCPGSVSVPSQYVSSGGNGGCSHFHTGGNGGGNYFGCGGSGGFGHMICGSDGKYGSGGGGSAPKMRIDPHSKNSGLGGDGLVIIEWC